MWTKLSNTIKILTIMAIPSASRTVLISKCYNTIIENIDEYGITSEKENHISKM